VLKNAPTDIALIQILKLLSSIPITILRGVKRGETKNMSMILKGKLHAFNHIPSLLKKRRKIQSARLLGSSELSRWFK